MTGKSSIIFDNNERKLPRISYSFLQTPRPGEISAKKTDCWFLFSRDCGKIKPLRTGENSRWNWWSRPTCTARLTTRTCCWEDGRKKTPNASFCWATFFITDRATICLAITRPRRSSRSSTRSRRRSSRCAATATARSTRWCWIFPFWRTTRCCFWAGRPSISRTATSWTAKTRSRSREETSCCTGTRTFRPARTAERTGISIPARSPSPKTTRRTAIWPGRTERFSGESWRAARHTGAFGPEGLSGQNGGNERKLFYG